MGFSVKIKQLSPAIQNTDDVVHSVLLQFIETSTTRTDDDISYIAIQNKTRKIGHILHDYVEERLTK